MVARFCVQKDKPFHLVLHGGGEPTVHPSLIERITDMTKNIAGKYGLDWFGYLATNGVMSESRAGWAAGLFSLIGLSCDGPPDIQDTLRPMPNGEGSSKIVERTARAISESGGAFLIRTTITPQTVHRQEEIVEYLHKRLGAAIIRIEPVYRAGRNTGISLSPQPTGSFRRQFHRC